YSNSMKYSKYFPNHQEYASKVYKDIPNKLLCIENQEHVDIPPKVNSEETPPEAITFASQTDGPIIMQACTQTVDQIRHDMATQTDDEKVTDIQKKVLAETPQAPRLELMHPQQSSARDEQPSTNPSSEQWECLKKFGEPRIVVSVIGAYNERITTYEWADDVLLKKALKHVARYTGRCGFLFQEKNTNLVQSVISRDSHIKGLPQQYGYFSVNYSNDDQYEGDASHHLNDLLELEKHINTEGQVSFQESEKGSKMLSNVRVPVALLVLNGDLETLDHVVRAIYNDMSVVVVKGTGGAADLIALCLEDFSSLKRELPIMLNRRFTKGLFAKVQEVFKMIIEKDWMISIFDIKVDEHDSLWERITDGITRAWSFEEKNEEITEYLSLHGGDCISKYVANIDGLTSRELFAGCSLNEADGRENKINEEIILGCNKNNVKLLQRVCPCDIEDSNAPKLIAEKLLKGLCFSKIGMITCCKRCRKPNGNDAENADASETVPTDETLQVAVLLNESERAATLWHQSENPMSTDDSGCSDNATIWNSDPSVEKCPTGDWITPVIAAVYMMLTNWLLLNIVIAMFSARFQEIRDNSEQKWRYYRHSVIMDFEDKIPSPLNFPFRIFSSVWYSTKYCSCCPCNNKPKADDNKDMLKKQQQFAKEIIAEERHQQKILKKQHLLKIGTFFPIFKNKGNIKDAINYRGIIVTPTLSKIIEKILEMRKNVKIIESQNPLQSGFTEDTAPLMCELIIEEFERENKDLKRPTCIRWNGHLLEPFLVEQGVGQGGAISADLYKVYVNPLLNLLCETGLGGKIGNINCCAPTCADDVSIIAANPLEIQSLVDIAVDFSRREGYLLQPTKSIILLVRTTTKTIETEEGFWNMDDKPMPVVKTVKHI
ncbi:Hypothetical predicted protein, partial [Mytilus galloprovincialis]